MPDLPVIVRTNSYIGAALPSWKFRDHTLIALLTLRLTIRINLRRNRCVAPLSRLQQMRHLAFMSAIERIHHRRRNVGVVFHRETALMTVLSRRCRRESAPLLDIESRSAHLVWSATGFTLAAAVLLWQWRQRSRGAVAA